MNKKETDDPTPSIGEFKTSSNKKHKSKHLLWIIPAQLAGLGGGVLLARFGTITHTVLGSILFASAGLFIPLALSFSEKKKEDQDKIPKKEEKGGNNDE